MVLESRYLIDEGLKREGKNKRYNESGRLTIQRIQSSRQRFGFGLEQPGKDLTFSN
jgi:hypothetical protein